MALTELCLRAGASYCVEADGVSQIVIRVQLLGTRSKRMFVQGRASLIAMNILFVGVISWTVIFDPR